MLFFVFRRSRFAGLSLLAIVAALLALGMLASVARAQNFSFTPITLVYLHGADTIATEQLTASATAWTGDLSMKGQPRIVWRQALAGNALGNLSLDVFAPGSGADAKPAQQASFVMKGDTAHVEMMAGGQTQKQAIPTKSGAVVLVNTSLAQTVVVANGALAQGKATFDVVLVSGGQTLGGTVKKTGDTLTFTLQGVEMRAVVDAQGLPVEITVPSQGLRIVRGARELRGMNPTNDKISYDAPPGAPYTAEHVRIPTDRDYTLAGTLTRPAGRQPVAVAITISGSGPQDRDSRISIVPGYAPFREIADTLARRGVATLRFDDRAVGESGGITTATTVTSVDFADDVRSIVAWLRTRPDIDTSKIMLIGHSEGGMIAPMVAARDKDIHAIALLAGSAYNGKRILIYQNQQNINTMLALPQQSRDSIMATIPARLDSLGRTSNWIGFFLNHDPLPVVREVKQPVLIVQGETDRQVTPEQADTLAAALREAGNRDVTLKKFAATNHLFLADPSGMPQGYPKLTDVKVTREVLGAIADWVSAQAGVRR